MIYASTDLNFDQARSTWEHFRLHTPRIRRRNLRETIEELYLEEQLIKQATTRDSLLKNKCKLNWISPFLDANAEEPDQQPFSFIYEPYTSNWHRKVYFLDLASYSAGDDWGLINHAVGLLQCRFRKPDSPHLLVVDAVEGLEAMAGTYDRFGLNRSRRSRLAQLIRLTRKANCHVIFVVEQKVTGEKLDEVFISDLVLRLRRNKTTNTFRRQWRLKRRGASPTFVGLMSCRFEMAEDRVETPR